MKTVKFSKVSSNNLNEVIKVAIKVLRSKLNIAKISYGLSEIQTFFKRVERL